MPKSLPRREDGVHDSTGIGSYLVKSMPAKTEDARGSLPRS